MMDETMGGNPHKFVEDIFGKCGYGVTYVSNGELQKNMKMCINALIDHIDRDIPVIVYGTPMVGVLAGYDDYGKMLLFITI